MEERIKQRIADLEKLERQAELNLHAIRVALGEFRTLLKDEEQPTITTGEERRNGRHEEPEVLEAPR